MLFWISNIFASSDECTIRDKDFLNYNTDFLSKNDKNEMLKLWEFISNKFKSSASKNTLFKKEIEKIISEIEIANSWNSFSKWFDWNRTKAKKYLLVKTIYSEFQKNCNENNMYK